MPMAEIKGEEKSLDLFYGLSASDKMERQRSGMLLLNQLCVLNKSDKEAFLKMAEYTLGRLIRAHSSSNIQTRGYMFTALSAILRICKGIENEFVVGLIEKNLAVEKEDTKSLRLNKRVAAILTCGALLHSRDITEFSHETLGDLVGRIAKNSISKQKFMEYGTPFFVELCEKANTQLKRKRKQKLFRDVVLPNMAPFVEKMKNSEHNFIHLRIALAWHSGKIGNDFEDFLRDQDAIVKTTMANDLLGIKEMEQLFEYYTNTNPATIDSFWTSITENISSSHFNHLCAMIEACSKNFSIVAALNEKILNSLYYTIRSIRMREHKAKAVATMTTIIKWISCSPHISKCPEDKGISIEKLFSGSQHVLHQYKELSAALKFMITTLNESELSELTTLCVKLIDEEKVSTQLCVTVVNMLTKIAQSPKISTETKAEIVKRVLTIGKCRAMAESKDDANDIETQEPQSEDISAIDDMLKLTGINAFRSILSATFNTDFMNIILNDPEIMEEFKSKEQSKSHEYKEAMKKSRKLLKQGKKDPYLYYVIGTYTLYLHLDATTALPVIDELKELLDNRNNPEDEKESAEIIVKVVLSKILREQQPMLNYERLFSRLIAKDLINDESIKSMADEINVGVEESDSEDEDDDDDDDDSDEDLNADKGADSDEKESEEEEEEEEVQPETALKIESSTNADEDSDASMDLDDAPEEDLKRLDMILAHAAKKRSKDGGDKEFQYTMRIKRLLKSVVKRKKSTPLGEMLKKKIKLV